MERVSFFPGILFLLTLLTTPVKGQDTSKESGSQKQESALSAKEANSPFTLPDNYNFTEIKNGLDILVIRDTLVPLVTLEMAFKTGAITEDSNWNGLHRLYENVFFEANRDYPSKKAIEKRKKALGAQLKTHTGYERVNYGLTLHKDQLVYGLDFLNAAIRYPELPDKVITQKKDALVKQLGNSAKNPRYGFKQELNNHLWGDQASRKSIQGRKSSLENLDASDIKELRNRYYYPNNALMVVAGDIEVKKALRWVRKIYGNWDSSKSSIFKENPVPAFNNLNRNLSFLHTHPEVDTPELVFAFRGPDTRHGKEATHSAKVYAEMLEKPRSPIYQQLIGKGLAHDFSVHYKPLHHKGHFTIRINPKADSIKAAGEKVSQFLEKADSMGIFPEKAISKARQQIVNRNFYKREKTAALPNKIAYWWASADIPYYTTYNDSIQAVQAHDLSRFARQYLKNTHHVRGALVTPDQKQASEVNQIARNTKPVEKYAALYALNSAEINDSADIEGVRDIEYIMRINPNARLTVHGYTDHTGPSWFNEELSRRRAESAKELILKWGRVEEERIETIGHGEQEKTDDPEKRKEYRSARFEITFPESNNE